MTHPGERIAKVMARCGLCSRRQAEEWILQKRVAVNGVLLTTPACNVTESDQISVDGKALPRSEPVRLWRFHKPRGCVTTSKDPQGRQTVFDLLPSLLPRVVTVGRLDMDSEGLLLLTNAGEASHYLENPQTGWTRTYRVRVHGRVDEAQLARLAQGITIQGIRYGAIHAALDHQVASNAWITFKLEEGKNREIRRVCEHFGWAVNRLIRTGFGPFVLGDLSRGAVSEVPGRILKNSLPKEILTCCAS